MSGRNKLNEKCKGCKFFELHLGLYGCNLSRSYYEIQQVSCVNNECYMPKTTHKLWLRITLYSIAILIGIFVSSIGYFELIKDSIEILCK